MNFRYNLLWEFFINFFFICGRRVKNEKRIRKNKSQFCKVPEIFNIARSIGSNRNMLKGWFCDHSFNSSLSRRSIILAWFIYFYYLIFFNRNALPISFFSLNKFFFFSCWITYFFGSRFLTRFFALFIIYCLIFLWFSSFHHLKIWILSF